MKANPPKLIHSCITLACYDEQAGDIAKVMTADNIRFPLLLVFFFFIYF